MIACVGRSFGFTFHARVFHGLYFISSGGHLFLPVGARPVLILSFLYRFAHSVMLHDGNESTLQVAFVFQDVLEKSSTPMTVELQVIRGALPLEEQQARPIYLIIIRAVD